MTGKTREKAAGYCGISNVKVALKQAQGYSTDLIRMKFAKGLTLNPQVESTEQYGDDRKLFDIPSDTGYQGELNTTAADPELEKAAGFSVEGSGGLMDLEMTSYARCAMYFEYILYPETARAKKAKVWLYNVQIGKGGTSHSTKEKSLTLGTYAYPIQVHGDTAMANDDKTYVDEDGMEHLVFRMTSLPGDEGYDTFGDAVPVPKVASVQEED